MACSKLFFLTMLAMIIFLSSPNNRFAAASRNLKTGSLDIPNFGFPELSPPDSKISFLPPKNELGSDSPDISNFGFPELAPLAPKLPFSLDIPNFGYPELAPPAPEFSFPPPNSEGSPNVPNFGFPELAPPFPKSPYAPPKFGLLTVSKIESKPPSPAVTKIPKIVPELGREIGSHGPLGNGPKPKRQIRSPMPSWDVHNVPNFGFPELAPPFPKSPYAPPKSDLLTVSKIESKPPSPTVTEIPKIVPELGREIRTPVPLENGPKPKRQIRSLVPSWDVPNVPNFGFPELAPPFPKSPYAPPKSDLLTVSEIESKPPLPAIIEIPKIVPELGREIISPMALGNGPKPKRQIRSPVPSWDVPTIPLPYQLKQ